jgi:hypothetical protein
MAHLIYSAISSLEEKLSTVREVKAGMMSVLLGGEGEVGARCKITYATIAL